MEPMNFKQLTMIIAAILTGGNVNETADSAVLRYQRILAKLREEGADKDSRGEIT